MTEEGPFYLGCSTTLPATGGWAAGEHLLKAMLHMEEDSACTTTYLPATPTTYHFSTTYYMPVLAAAWKEEPTRRRMGWEAWEEHTYLPLRHTVLPVFSMMA
jgi:hypothetical protein